MREKTKYDRHSEEEKRKNLEFSSPKSSKTRESKKQHFDESGKKKKTLKKKINSSSLNLKEEKKKNKEKQKAEKLESQSAPTTPRGADKSRFSLASLKFSSLQNFFKTTNSSSQNIPTRKSPSTPRQDQNEEYSSSEERILSLPNKKKLSSLRQEQTEEGKNSGKKVRNKGKEKDISVQKEASENSDSDLIPEHYALLPPPGVRWGDQLEDSPPTTSPVTPEESMMLPLSPKKFSFSAYPELLLDKLINLEMQAMPWENALSYQYLSEPKQAGLEEEDNFLWHTRESLETLCLSPVLILQGIKKQEIHLLKRLCVEYLNPTFQRYSELFKDEEGLKQAYVFSEYLKDSIDKVMSEILFDQLQPLFNPEIQEDLATSLSRHIEFSKECLELRLEAMLRVQILRFYEAKTCVEELPHILEFFKENMDLEGYNVLLNQLADLIYQGQSCAKQNSSKAEALFLAYEKENYIRLSSLLPPNESLIEKTISELAKHFSTESNQSCPQCNELELDLYIPKESALVDQIKLTVDLFEEDYKKLKDSSSDVLINIMANKLADSLKEILTPSRASAHLSYN